MIRMNSARETFNNGNVYSVVKLVSNRTRLTSQAVIYVGSFGYLVTWTWKDKRKREEKRCTKYVFSNRTRPDIGRAIKPTILNSPLDMEMHR